MNSNPSFEVKNCINARIHRLTRLIDEVYRSRISGLGLTESQMSMLLSIDQHREISQADLGRHLHLERSSVSRNLRRLIDQGLVRRETQPDTSLLSLTKAGKSRVQTLLPHWEAAMADLYRKLGPDGLQALALLERRLLD